MKKLAGLNTFFVTVYKFTGAVILTVMLLATLMYLVSLGRYSIWEDWAIIEPIVESSPKSSALAKDIFDLELKKQGLIEKSQSLINQTKQFSQQAKDQLSQKAAITQLANVDKQVAISRKNQQEMASGIVAQEVRRLTDTISQYQRDLDSGFMTKNDFEFKKSAILSQVAKLKLGLKSEVYDSPVLRDRVASLRDEQQNNVFKLKTSELIEQSNAVIEQITQIDEQLAKLRERPFYVEPGTLKYYAYIPVSNTTIKVGSIVKGCKKFRMYLGCEQIGTVKAMYPDMEYRKHPFFNKNIAVVPSYIDLKSNQIKTGSYTDIFVE